MERFLAAFKPRFLSSQAWWLENQPKVANKVKTLTVAILCDPFRGIGKPEPLRHSKLKGCWSRRVTGEHRLVYLVDTRNSYFFQLPLPLS